MNIDTISNPSTPDGVSTWKPAQDWCIACDQLVKGNDDARELDCGYLIHTDCIPDGELPEHGSYLLRLMVRGASRDIRLWKNDLDAAIERTARWRASNSTGHYHAQIWLGSELVQENDGTMHEHSTTGLGLCSGCQAVRDDIETAHAQWCETEPAHRASQCTSEIR